MPPTPSVQVPYSVFSEVDSVTNYRRLSARDRVATFFAAAILFLMAAILCSILLQVGHLPAPDLTKVALTDQKMALENYHELSKTVEEHSEKIFDFTITKGLLPIFATIIGFLLGQHRKED